MNYKLEQRHLFFRGRDFHFVTYEGHPGNERRAEAAVGPMWYLMGPGKRWPVMPHTAGQSEEELMNGILSWLGGHGLGKPPKGTVFEEPLVPKR